MEKFAYMLQNQSLFAEIYRKEKRARHLEKVAINKEKNWYGNSAEYRREYTRLYKRRVKDGRRK
jgi:hypothetical protein